MTLFWCVLRGVPYEFRTISQKFITFASTYVKMRLMAIVQYTAIVNQLRGKLNGSVFNKSKNAFTLGSKQQPRKGATISQNRIRNSFGQIQRTWRTLTPSQQQSWSAVASSHPVRDRFGELVFISGYNWFIRANMFRLQSLDTILLTPNESAVSTYVFQDYLISSLTIGGAPSSQNLLLISSAIVQVSSSVPVYHMTYISKPQSGGVTIFYGNWRFMSRGVVQPDITPGLVTNFNSSESFSNLNATYKAGDIVFIRQLFVTIANGITYQEFVTRVVISS